jgi:hypothetical protein
MGGKREAYGEGLSPVWADIRTASAITGVPDNTIRHLFNMGRVGARQMRDAGMRGGRSVAVRFHVPDLLDWVENEAVPPKRYALKSMGEEGGE